jgi:iron-sulfur cluster repair protein YtfE (RIC family)
MTQTLPQVSHDQRERLLRHIDRMPDVADNLLTGDPATVVPSLREMLAFLTGTLVPHMDAAQDTIYPELERMFQNRHSMAPMRREHAEIRRQVDVLARLVDDLDARGVTLGRKLVLRRVLFQLYALLKIHVAEEDAFMRIIERGVTDDVAELLAAALDYADTSPA